MRKALTERELEDRRAVAAEVYQYQAGKDFVHLLLDDLGLYDVPESESEMVLHNFGLVFLKRYFETTIDHREHRSLLTEAIIGAWKPPKEI